MVGVGSHGGGLGVMVGVGIHSGGLGSCWMLELTVGDLGVMLGVGANG